MNLDIDKATGIVTEIMVTAKQTIVAKDQQIAQLQEQNKMLKEHIKKLETPTPDATEVEEEPSKSVTKKKVTPKK